jgi:uncharacterized protein (TIGR02466 family)
MSLDIISPFPPLIFKDHYTEFSEIHLNAASEILTQSNNYGKSYLEIGDACSSVSNQIIAPHTHNAFQHFFNWQNTRVLEIIKKYYQLSQEFDYVIGNSWVNLHKKGGYTKEHCHGMSAISTVAYIKIPKNSGNTEFKDPHFNLRSLHERSDFDQGLKEWCEFPAIEGDVLFFPGWMQHRSQPNNSFNDRWIISTNYVNFNLLKPMTFRNLI